MIDDLPTVRLELSSRPEASAFVRSALSGIAELLEFDPELLDDLKTAVSEACNNVVVHAYPTEPGPLTVELAIEADSIEVLVQDRGIGFDYLTPAEEPTGVGLAVINALSDHAQFTTGPHQGTKVRMTFTRIAYRP